MANKPLKDMTPEELRAYNRESNARYRAKKRQDPAWRQLMCDRQKKRYAEKKHDPSYLKPIYERNLRNYHENIKTSSEKMNIRREKTQKIQATRRARFQEKKIYLQQVLGGKCVRCGLTDHRLLDFDHIDPLKKTMMISQELHRAIEELLEEIKNCQLLCPNCHRLKTIESKQFDFRVRDYRNKSRESSFL